MMIAADLQALIDGGAVIGRGQFTRVYGGERGRVVIVTIDPLKEAYAMDWLPDTPLFPRFESEGHDREYRSVYTAPRLDVGSKIPGGLRGVLRPRQWRLYQALRRCTGCIGTGAQWDNARRFDSLPAEFSREREYMREAIDCMHNWCSRVGFEVSPRNVAATAGGSLVLFDVFFDIDRAVRRERF